MGKCVALIIGADGLIGRALADHLSRNGYLVLETTRRLKTVSESRIFLNLADNISNWSPPTHVSIAYFFAAVTSLDECRRNPKQSEIVNVHNTVKLVKALVASGIYVVFPSTNLVFDGSIPFRKALNRTCPQTVYGKQKAQVERKLLALGDSISVVRFTKIFGPKTSLIKRWIEDLRNNQVIHPLSDVVVAPTPLSFAVEVLHRSTDVRLGGIVQVSGAQDITYEEVARYLAQRIGARSDLVQPIRSELAGLDLEAIPSHTTLDTSRLRMELQLEPPDVWTTIDSVVGL